MAFQLHCWSDKNDKDQNRELFNMSGGHCLWMGPLRAVPIWNLSDHTLFISRMETVGHTWGKTLTKEVEPHLLISRWRNPHQALSLCSVSNWARGSIWIQILDRATELLKGQAKKKFTVPQRKPARKQEESINKLWNRMWVHEKWMNFSYMY